MKAFVENPVSVLRYHPTSFGDWDMANIQHASIKTLLHLNCLVYGLSPMLPERQFVGQGEYLN